MARRLLSLAMFVVMPTTVVASCHIVGGTGDLYIDPAFHGAASGGDGGDGGVGPGPTTSAGGMGAGGTGSGGEAYICMKEDCEGVDTDCRKIACIDNTCGATNVGTGEGCFEVNGAGFCDGAGHCVECINDETTPCPDQGTCQNNECFSADCADEAQNNGESDVDCGGPNCGACESGKSCNVPDDCTSLLCDSGTCVSCASVGCESDEWCEDPTGRCHDKKALLSGCGDDEECISGCCFLNGCAPSSWCN